MAETEQGRVIVVVTGAMVPILESGIRAQLYCSKRHCRAGKRMSVTTSPGKYIYEAGQILGIRRLRARLAGPHRIVDNCTTGNHAGQS